VGHELLLATVRALRDRGLRHVAEGGDDAIAHRDRLVHAVDSRQEVHEGAVGPDEARDGGVDALRVELVAVALEGLDRIEHDRLGAGGEVDIARRRRPPVVRLARQPQRPLGGPGVLDALEVEAPDVVLPVLLALRRLGRRRRHHEPGAGHGRPEEHVPPDQDELPWLEDGEVVDGAEGGLRAELLRQACRGLVVLVVVVVVVVVVRVPCRVEDGVAVDGREVVGLGGRDAHAAGRLGVGRVVAGVEQLRAAVVGAVRVVAHRSGVEPGRGRGLLLGGALERLIVGGRHGRLEAADKQAERQGGKRSEQPVAARGADERRPSGHGGRRRRRALVPGVASAGGRMRRAQDGQPGLHAPGLSGAFEDRGSCTAGRCKAKFT